MARSATKPGGLGACPHYRTLTDPNKLIALATCDHPRKILSELETVDNNLGSNAVEFVLHRSDAAAEEDVSYAPHRYILLIGHAQREIFHIHVLVYAFGCGMVRLMGGGSQLDLRET